MTSVSKKNKCKRTFYDRGGEKGHISKIKRIAMYHKKDRRFSHKQIEEYTKQKEE